MIVTKLNTMSAVVNAMRRHVFVNLNVGDGQLTKKLIKLQRNFN